MEISHFYVLVILIVFFIIALIARRGWIWFGMLGSDIVVSYFAIVQYWEGFIFPILFAIFIISLFGFIKHMIKSEDMF